MRERPILFSAPMVRALLAGTKTQTRRIVKPQPEHGLQRCHYSRTGWAANRDAEGMACTCVPASAPYGWPGDRLWVKETLRRSPDLWTYGADGAEVGWPGRQALAGKSRDVIVSIHCPRVASRITLEITDVRVERLNDISEADARAEGCRSFGPDPGGDHDVPTGGAVEAYERLWEQINGTGSWAANPWVWAVSFQRVSASADADPKGRKSAETKEHPNLHPPGRKGL